MIAGLSGPFLVWGIGVWKFAGTAAALVSLPGTVELLLLTSAGILPYRRKTSAALLTSWSIAAVVPAHNEEDSIRICIQSLQSAAKENFKTETVVIADNCTDATAAVARLAGATVLERQDPTRRGKGYALDFAFNALLDQGFDAFLIVDADTTVQNNFFIEMSRLMQSGAAAVQCRYLGSRDAQTIRARLMIVAQRAFNILRARGRHNLGFSCGIYGNGFGMRREVLEAVPYLADSLVEDLEYHLALIRSGRKVEFADRTMVYGQMPVSGKGLNAQRARWEGGRLRMLRQQAGGLVTDVLTGRLRSFEPLLDLLLLPLAFHVTLLLVSASTPLPIVRWAGILGLCTVAAHLLAGIVIGGGGWKDVTVLLGAPFYIAWKLILIPSLVSHSRANAKWVRSERAPGKTPL
jgi:cellulose synthase/poly-beta-1,6-N-acetylglucosamine synthase-like glycosyltransferase